MKSQRLASLDALRGFDMFWIMGGSGLLCTVMAALGYPDFRDHFGHVPWDGLQFMDTVFPTFLFLAGVSFPFSCAKSLERGMSRASVALKSLRRGIALFLLGLVYGGFLVKLDFANFRIPSVLGYIGFGWMVASWIYLYVRNCWVRLALAAVILAAVTVFLGLVRAPDADTVVISGKLAELGKGPFTPAGNFGCWLDRTILGNHILNRGLFDNEGFGGLLPTVVTALLGMFAGDIVRAGDGRATGVKALRLVLAAAVCLIAGLLLAQYCPIIKNLWSPSFVLVVGAYSFAMFAVFYWVVDVKRWERWSFCFRIVGMNSITIYMAQRFIDFDKASRFFLGGLAGMLPEAYGIVLIKVGYVVACWLFLLFLYRKNVFLKV